MTVACLVCGNKLDMATAASSENRSPPMTGDISICTYCGNIAEFDETGGWSRSLRKTAKSLVGYPESQKHFKG